jgi:hypothetical protein
MRNMMKSMFIFLFFNLFLLGQSQAADKYKIKYEATVIYTEPDGTKIVLPMAVGKIWMRVSDGACQVRVGAWESDIFHICRIPKGEAGMAPIQVELADATIVTMLLESLKFLMDKKYAYSLKIFNRANVYQNDQLIDTRTINQSSTGSLFVKFNEANRITLEHQEFKNKIKIEMRFFSLRKTIKKTF